MPWLDKLERRAGWLAFPGLFRFYVIFAALVHALSWPRPELLELLDFDRAKILSGEVWRIVTFLFAPGLICHCGSIAVQAIFLFFAVMIGFLVSDSLESSWGVFRTSFFLYCGILSLLVANFLMPISGMSGTLFYSSAFFAFATLFPRYEFLLFFIFPAQVRFLAIVGAFALLVQAFKFPLFFVYFLFAFANYFLWILPDLIRARRGLATATVRRQKFETARQPESPSFHKCTVCGRTEHDDPHLDFRVGPDGKEYCSDHLPDE